MKRYFLILIGLLLLLIPFYFPVDVSASSNKISIQKVISTISAIQTYQVNLNTKIFPPNASDLNPNAPKEFDPNHFMEVKSTVYGESGKKMKILTVMKPPQFGMEIEHTLIFDGTWLWVQKKLKELSKENTGKPVITAMKIHIPSVSPDPVNEPFNTIYGITGTGLFRYKDLPGTFLELIENYSFENGIKASDSKEIIFSGTKKAVENKTEIGKTNKQLAEFMSKNTNFCRLWVSSNNDRIVAYSIGKSEKRPTMKTEIEYITINKELPDNIFTYVQPEGVTVRDATANILKKNERVQ